MGRSSLPAVVRIREVGPRDGLQAEEPVAPKERAALVDALAEAGLQEIEAVSFVSPRAVPAMAGAAEVMAALRRKPTVRYLALVPNRKGAELALDADVDGLTVTVSASPVYNERNVHMTIDQSVSAVAEIAERVAPRALPVDAVVSCAFGSPYEGDIAPVEVNRLGERLKEVGAMSLTFADTTGMATPRRVHDLLEVVGPDVGLHLHDTRGTALVNAYAALERGVTRFDTAAGGIGGSPFAAGAGGNLAHPVPSRVAVAGPRDRSEPG
ncbi:MAG: hydroxymethylglutaryl-CoA lyase [Chloroflexi bacterium]|nr:MAG: hydroxymethylglutaryl-CoA lyase [Chloroflexota bacterium]